MTAYRTLCVLQNNVCIISDGRTPLVIVDDTDGETTVVLGLQQLWSDGVDWKCRIRKWRTKKDKRTENAGLKMQDKMSGVENAGAKNAGTPKNAANLFH